MVQSTVDGRSRARRTKQSEEQAPLVESYLSSNSSTIYNGEEEERSLILDSQVSLAYSLNFLACTAFRSVPASIRSSRNDETLFCGFSRELQIQEVVWGWGLMRSAYLHREHSSQLIGSPEARYWAAGHKLSQFMRTEEKIDRQAAPGKYSDERGQYCLYPPSPPLMSRS